MAKHIVRGKTCKVSINIPNSWDKHTKKVVLTCIKYCLPKDRQREVIGHVNNLVFLENELIKAIKATGERSKELEKKIRGFLGLNLNHGFQVGSMYSMEEITKFRILIKQQSKYKEMVEKVVDDKLEWIIIYYSTYLGRMAYETGFMIGTSVS